MIQGFSLLGALLQLIPFFLIQTKKITDDHWVFQYGNIVGSFIMVCVAVLEVQYGFILMEGIWCLVGVYGLYRRYNP
jgi:hypothetical protein